MLQLSLVKRMPLTTRDERLRVIVKLIASRLQVSQQIAERYVKAFR